MARRKRTTIEERKAQYRFYRGYIYRRSAAGLSIYEPTGAFICLVSEPRQIVKVVNWEIRHKQVA